VQLYPDTAPQLESTMYLRLRSSPPAPQRVIALNSRCTHLGCPTRYVEVSERFICPCHGGVFDFDGRGLAPIAPKRLRRYRTAVRDGTVYIGPSLDPPIKIPYS
jgi:quinol---cytochrome c reductase iron-sulfur subunit, bacillus type